MKVNQLKAGVILSYVSQAIHILSSLIYTPVMLRLLGQSEYGLYQLVASVVSHLNLLSLGFGAGYMRFYSRYKANDDEQGITRLNGMFFLVFSVISVICLLCGAVLILNAETVFGSGLSAAEISKAKVLMSMLIFNMALSFLGSVYGSHITAHEKFFFQRSVDVLRALFNPFLTLPLLLMGYGSVGVVAITSFLTIFSFVLNVWYSFKNLKISFSFRNFDFGLLKEMWIFTFFIFINMIVDQINWSVDKFLLGRMIGTTAVAVYGVASELNVAYQIFSGSISSVFIPRVNLIVAKANDNDELTNLFTKVGRIQFLILALLMSGYFLYGKIFIHLWAGPGYDEAYVIGFFLMLSITVPLMQNLGIEIRRAQNLHRIPAVFMLLVSIMNFVISIPLIKIFGATGAAVGTAIGIFFNTIFINIYYHKKCHINILYFWKEILKFIPALFISVMTGLLINGIVGLDSIWKLGTCIVTYSAVYFVVIYLLGLNQYEKEIVKGFVKRSA